MSIETLHSSTTGPDPESVRKYRPCRQCGAQAGGTPAQLRLYPDWDLLKSKAARVLPPIGEFYYVSGSKALYKYDKTGKLLLANENPF